MVSQRKIFCISMQRSGTTSVGDWLAAHGLRRAGFPISSSHHWTRYWMEGNYEAIFQSTAFRETDVFEDDPWWCPEFHRHLATRFPDAIFVLLTRDPAMWFQSLCNHSSGRNPGPIDIHCRIYRREEELEELRRSGADPHAWNLLDITMHADHYMEVYQRHTGSVVEAFSAMPQRLFMARLDDSATFPRICDFAGIPRNPSIPVPRSNAATPAMRAALHDYIVRRREVGTIPQSPSISQHD